MTSADCWNGSRLLFASLVVLLGLALNGQADSRRPLPCCLDQLKRLSYCELATLYAQAEVGNPLAGRARGRLLLATDGRLPRLKVGAVNAVWRGKHASADGWFVNRWVGGLRAIESHYVVGPSWVDGRPCLVMEYAPGTPLFANTRDELREISPGLYLGPLYERCPCPRLRGYIALEVKTCTDAR